NSVKVLYLDRDALLKHLCEIARDIKTQHPEVRSISLFGSLARGDYTAISDVDILITLHHSKEKDPHQRILTFLPYFDLERGVDLLVYTQEEVERRLSEGDPFLQRIQREGIALS
ncbi:MAG: nucleotidyltransferase domain-containing protein, partial [Anaerolineae bacterium]